MPELLKARLRPFLVANRHRKLRARAARQILTAGGAKQPLAGVAVTQPSWPVLPPITEESIYPVVSEDFAMHLGHEFEIIRTECACDQSRLRQRLVPARFAILVDIHSFGMRGGRIR